MNCSIAIFAQPDEITRLLYFLTWRSLCASELHFLLTLCSRTKAEEDKAEKLQQNGL